HQLPARWEAAAPATARSPAAHAESSAMERAGARSPHWPHPLSLHLEGLCTGAAPLRSISQHSDRCCPRCCTGTLAQPARTPPTMSPDALQSYYLCALHSASPSGGYL